MTFLVTLYILILNSLNSIAKSNKFVLYSSVFFMILLFGGIHNCADNLNYRNLYEFVKTNGIANYAFTEFGFIVFTFVCIKIGLTFTLYRTLIGAIGLLLIQKTVFEHTKKYNFVFFLYFIYPFIFDVIQIQNFLALSILVFSMKFLIPDNRKSKVMYIIGVLIATSIHYMSIFFLPFVFVEKISIRQLVRFTLIFVPILVILTKSAIIPSLIKYFIGNDLMAKLTPYFQKANWGFLLLWALQLGFCIVTYQCYKIINKSEIDENWKVFGKLIVKLNIYLIIICFPLVIFNANFLRLHRNMLILNYLIMSQSLYVNPKKSLILLLATIFLTFYFFSLDLLTESNILFVLIPFFNSNIYL
jgi:hypothetical protein